MGQRTTYGGQAVIEGVMIRGRERVATACRMPDGSITVRRDEADSLVRRFSWLRFPFLRGTPILIDSLRLGYKTLMWSADLAMDGEKEQKPTTWQYALTIAASFAFGIGLFVLLPSLALKWVFPGAEGEAASKTILEQLMPTWSALIPNIAEGILRVLVLIAYILVISFNKEIRRVFAYHGAEHKVVNAWEHGSELTTSAAKEFSRIHRRCGTSFLFLVFIVGIVIHSLFGWQVWWLRLPVRLLMIIPIAGIAYELVRLAGRYEHSILLKILVWPGMALQRLTTAEPADDQIDVAITSLRTVLEDEGVLQPAAETSPTDDTSSSEQVAIA